MINILLHSKIFLNKFINFITLVYELLKAIMNCVLRLNF